MRLAVAIALILAAAKASAAAETVLSAEATITNDDSAAATVNFSDPLTYTKPYARTSSTVPSTVFLPSYDEGSIANKYYVDLDSGSGSTCSSGAPCATINDVSGKTGTSGGPVVIYVRGTAPDPLNITSGTIFGATNDPIVVKPWPSDSTPAVWTADAGCSRAVANQIDATNVHHWIIDGGPDMLIRFNGSGCTSDQNGYTLWFGTSDFMTLYRIRIDAMDSGGPALGSATGDGIVQTNFAMVNSEIYNANRYYGVYIGGGSTCVSGSSSVATDHSFVGNVIRDVDGRGIQVEPRDDSSGVIIEGNVFHNVGYNNSGSQNISTAVQAAGSCFGDTDQIKVSNNIGWDLGGGMIRTESPSGFVFDAINNTVWDYGNATPVEANSHAVTAGDDTNLINARNNVLLAPANGGIDPFNPNRDGQFTTNDNVCETGTNCGTGAIVGTAAGNFDSTTDGASFLKPNGSSLGNCLVIAGYTTDYLGASRGSVGAATDCGAINEP